MKILINGLQIGKQNSGIQYYAQHLYNNLKHSITDKLSIYLYFYHKQPRLLRIIQENFYLPRYLKKKQFDLYHSPNYVLPFIIKSPTVITVHDLITFDFPELCQKESVLYFRLFLPVSIKKSDKIIAVSNTVKEDILKHFNIPESKIVVIPLGISKIFQKTIIPDVLIKYKIFEKYILFVGNIEPKKNLERLIEAYHKLIKTKNITHNLVIAGKNAWKYNQVYSKVHSSKLDNRVIFTGYVPESDLPALYSMADLFVFPSIYEGFGIPPLEAMACETVALVSNRGALPETTGRNCIMVDPYDVENIAENIHILLTKPQIKNKLIKAGKEWVKQFTWERTAKETLLVYNSILEKNKYAQFYQ